MEDKGIFKKGIEIPFVVEQVHAKEEKAKMQEQSLEPIKEEIVAAIHDLIDQIENPELRARIQQELDRMNKQKKFGLVFEEHLPECTPLYDIPVRKGSTVALKVGKVSETYVVLKLKDDTAVCLPKGGGEPAEFPVADLVTVAEFGEAIYPYLKSIDSVCNAPDSDLWHTLIEADNYHALQLLEYLYTGKVDCIYIDPPYNTGAKDWKYNNDYVDGSDTYRHSKWLSMMQKRFSIAISLRTAMPSVNTISPCRKRSMSELIKMARNMIITCLLTKKALPSSSLTVGKKVSWKKKQNERILFAGFETRRVRNGLCAFHMRSTGKSNRPILII